MKKKNYKKELIEFYQNVKKIYFMPEMRILPGQLAYFFVLAIVPTLTLLSVGASLLNLSTDVVYEFLSSAFSDDIASMLLATNHEVGDSLFQIFIVTALGYMVAANGASSIIIASNTVYGIKNANFIVRYIKSLVMITILLFLFLFMLLVPMFGTSIIMIFEMADVNQILINNLSVVINIFQGPLHWLILFIFIKLIYTMAPDTKIESKSTNSGALFTTINWIIITHFYSIYINTYANYSMIYGNLANLVILLLWFHFLAIIFTMGLGFNCQKKEI